MTKNTGKLSEQIFDETFARMGKRAYVFKFTDASEATGMNKRVVGIKAQPADRLLCVDGETCLAEVKSTVDPRKFSFSLLRPTQSAHAKMILAAGGRYDVFIHSLAHDRWYRVSYAAIRAQRDLGQGSMSWEMLSPLEWKLPHA